MSVSSFFTSSSLHLFTQNPKFSVATGALVHRTSCITRALVHQATSFSEGVAFCASIKPKKIELHLPISPNLSSFNRFLINLSAFAVSDGAEEMEEDEEKEGGVDEEAKSIEDGRLYVGNLPFSMTPSQLSEIFAEAGEVTNVEIVYDRVTDRSRGFAFVTMGSVEDAKEAIRLFDGSQAGGRTVKVNFPEVPRGGEREVMSAKIRSTYQGFVDSPHKLYASNLSWNLTSQGLKDAFADQPGFLSAKVIYDRASGRSRGFGFITFSAAEGMNNALDTMNEVDLEGRPLRLNVAGERTPVSSPPVVETSPENDSEDGEILSSISS